MEDIQFDGKTYVTETYESGKSDPALDNAICLRIEEETGEQRAGIWEIMHSQEERHLLSLERDEDIPAISDPDHQFVVSGSDFIALQHFLREFSEYRDLNDEDHIITTDDPDLSQIFEHLLEGYETVEEEESQDILKVMVEAISRFSREVDEIEVSDELAEGEAIRAHSMLKLASVRMARERLETIIETEEGEDECQDLLEAHSWILGNEYVAKSDRELLYEGELDFGLVSVDGFLDFVELKRPDMDPVNHDPSHDTFYPTHELNKAISQLSYYIREAEREEDRISSGEDGRPLKPRGKIVIGSDLEDEKRQGLRILESHLTRIDLLTYSDLLSRAERIEQLYERDGELETIDLG